MMYSNDRQRKAMFANIFSDRPGRPNIKFELGYEQAVSDEELMDIINKPVDFAELPEGTVEYFPISEFGKINAKRFADTHSEVLSGGDIKSRSVPVYDEGVMIGYSSIASKRGKLFDVAPKVASTEFYSEMLDTNTVPDEEFIEEGRLRLVEAWSGEEAAKEDLYYMYDKEGGKLSYDEFMDHYNKLLSKGLSQPDAFRKIKEVFG